MRRAILFGKLPAHGDFVARGLAAAARDALDGWLSASLADARSWAGEGFEGRYDQAPPWRFATRAEGHWQAGALAPSIDGTGRRYPVMIGLDGVDGGQVAGAAEALEALIYAALAGKWDADRLVAVASGCAGGRDSVWTGGDRWWTVGGGSGTGGAFPAAGIAGARPPRLMRAMLTVGENGREGAA